MMYLVQLDDGSPLERKIEHGKLEEQYDLPYDDQAGMDVILGNLKEANMPSKCEKISTAQMVFSLFKAVYYIASNYVNRKW